MDKAWGNATGVVTKVRDDGHGLDIEFRASHGGICYAYDLQGHLQCLEVGMKLDLEEADISFDNGRITYLVDEDLRGVSINDVPVGQLVHQVNGK